MAKPKAETKFGGIVFDVMPFRGSQDGAGVITLQSPTGKGKGLKIIGVVEGVKPGDEVEGHGLQVEHPHYGLQIRAARIRTKLPSAVPEAQEWLTRHFVVPWTQARDFMSAWGHAATYSSQEECVAKLWRAVVDPNSAVQDLLVQFMPGVAADIRNYVLRKLVIDELVELNLDTKDAFALYRILGNAAVTRVREDPYTSYYYLDNVSFNKLDAIYLDQAGNQKGDVKRVKAVCLYALRSCADDGHTAMYYEDFMALVEAEYPEFSPGLLLSTVQDLIPEFMVLYGSPTMIQLTHNADYEAGISEFIALGSVKTLPPGYEKEEEDDE